MGYGFEFGEQSTAYFVRVRGTVIRRIFWTVLCYLVYVCAISLLHVHVIKLGLANKLAGVLGIIISLLLGFRAKDSLARYNEGRLAFCTLKKTVRAMSQAVWILVPVYTAQDLVEMKTVVNLLDGFCYALKHYLREEYSYDEPDMRSHTKFVPRFSGRSKADGEKPLTKWDRQVACEFKPPTNIPQEILYSLTIYSQYIREKNDSINTLHWVFNFDSGLNNMEAILSQLETLQRTPMVLCYASHLEHSFWIYLLALPFQLVGPYGFWTLPILGFGFFFFVGVMSLSIELEDPFGYDDNDLPLDDYCYTIRRELNQVTANASPEGTESSWVLSPENLPLSPYSQLNASEWASKSLDAAHEVLFDMKLPPPQEPQSRKYWQSKSKRIAGAENKGQDNPTPVQLADENV